MRESRERSLVVPPRGLAVCVGGECRYGSQSVPYDEELVESLYLREKLRSQKGQFAVLGLECWLSCRVRCSWRR